MALQNSPGYIDKYLLNCRKRLAALPIQEGKPTLDVGNFLVPVWHMRPTIREDDSYNIFDCAYNEPTAAPQVVAMFMQKEEATFLVNAPADIAFLLTLVDHAKKKIKQLESEVKELHSQIIKN